MTKLIAALAWIAQFIPGVRNMAFVQANKSVERAISTLTTAVNELNAICSARRQGAGLVDRQIQDLHDKRAQLLAEASRAERLRDNLGGLLD